MSLLFETIRLKDGVLHNLEYHNIRFNHSRKSLYKSTDTIALEQLIQIPANCKKGLFRCRVSYSKEIKTIDFEPYVSRVVKSLRMIEANTILYNYKYTNRGRLNELLTKRERFDEILIIKNGFVTDTSHSNIIFFDGTNWVTPSTPLLHGTMRSFLLKNEIISEMKIKVPDLKQFQKARLINAMIPFEDGKDIKITKIGY
jgi:4-amino-4-deoxychorismate lyase